MGSSAEEIQAHVRQYMVVFAALAGLTVVTVAVSYIDLSIGPAIAVALFIATIQASLVAAVFMHLVSEKKAIFWVLGLTAVFFVVLMCVPLFTSGLSDNTIEVGP